MTPTPILRGSNSMPNSVLVLLTAVGAVAVLAVIGVATGAIHLTSTRVRRSTRGTAMGVDAVLSPRGRRESIEYLLHDQHTIVLDQDSGDGDPDEGRSTVLYEVPDDGCGEACPD